MITVKDLCMDFDGKKVLDNVSFEIPEGEIIGIIGRSGAGKSVLMHLLRGVEQPPTGVLSSTISRPARNANSPMCRALPVTVVPCAAGNWSQWMWISGMNGATG